MKIGKWILHYGILHYGQVFRNTLLPIKQKIFCVHGYIMQQFTNVDRSPRMLRYIANSYRSIFTAFLHSNIHSECVDLLIFRAILRSFMIQADLIRLPACYKNRWQNCSHVITHVSSWYFSFFWTFLLSLLTKSYTQNVLPNTKLIHIMCTTSCFVIIIFNVSLFELTML